MAEGLDNEEIARRIFTSKVTVQNHTSSIYSKLGVRKRAKAKDWTPSSAAAEPGGSMGSEGAAQDSIARAGRGRAGCRRGRIRHRLGRFARGADARVKQRPRLRGLPRQCRRPRSA